MKRKMVHFSSMSFDGLACRACRCSIPSIIQVARFNHKRLGWYWS